MSFDVPKVSLIVGDIPHDTCFALRSPQRISGVVGRDDSEFLLPIMNSPTKYSPLHQQVILFHLKS